MPNKAIRIMLVDSFLMVRNGLRLLIETNPNLRVIAEACNSQEALAQLALHAPDLVLMNIHSSGENALALASMVLAGQSFIKIIVLSSDPNPALAEAALQIGVSGYVLQENRFEEVVRAIQASMEGKLYLCSLTTTLLIRGRFQKDAAPPDATPKLSVREKQLLQSIADGMHNKEIAVHLKVTPRSVEIYRARLQKKLNCRSTAELIRYAIREKIVIA